MTDVFISIAATADPSIGFDDARDLGHLLHKHPDRTQEFKFGTANVICTWPHATTDHAEMLIAATADDDVADVSTGWVTDRRWRATSHLSSAISKALNTATAGRCSARPDLVDVALPLTVTVANLGCPGSVARAWFEPFGYDLTVTDLGAARCTVTFTGHVTVSAVLSQLRILTVAADGGDRHYFAGDEQAQPLLTAGWLPTHPHATEIIRRFLSRQPALARHVLKQLNLSRPAAGGGLRRSRIEAVLDRVADLAPGVITDIGCGEGVLLERFADLPTLTHVNGIDIHGPACTAAVNRLRRLGHPVLVDDEPVPDHAAGCVVRVKNQAGSVADVHLAASDLVTMVEVIEHMDPDQLNDTLVNVFEVCEVPQVLITTPNRDHNVLYPDPTRFRHPDHRFEFTREEFTTWTASVADRFGYTVTRFDIGDPDPVHGPPTQAAVFTRKVGR